jgi:cobalt-zinc-cadmium efflux system membrane fusion protein
MLAQRSMASQQELAAARAEATALDAESNAAGQRLQALGLGSQGATRSSRCARRSRVRHARGGGPGSGRDGRVSVATIVSIDRAWFVARIFEHMLAKVQVGAVAEVELNAYPDHPFLGKVEHLAATVDAGGADRGRAHPDREPRGPPAHRPVRQRPDRGDRSERRAGAGARRSATP